MSRRIGATCVGVAIMLGLGTLDTISGVAQTARVAVVGSSAQSRNAMSAMLDTSANDVRLLRPIQLQELAAFDPDLVLVTSDTAPAWPTLSPSTLKRVFGSLKVIGFGSGGADLFQALGSGLGRAWAMHAPGDYVVELVDFPTDVVSRPQIPAVITLYRGVRSDALGIYDDGSPARHGFEALARWQRHAHHWPVARQGNLLLWGFDAPLASLTEEGHLLFEAVLQDHAGRTFTSFEEVATPPDFVSPGTIEDQLTAQFSGQHFPFRVRGPGLIHAELTSTQRGERLALILNGPARVGAYAREDGRPPLRIDFPVTEELVRGGDEWRISVRTFGDIAAPIDFKLILDFPH